ncbi:MAG TPA: DUF5931 domain-containing protein [Dermatophilaceae bacterium]|nr:DUF5931 domain-containing protein [Dermatophilaceae bacterium]
MATPGVGSTSVRTGRREPVVVEAFSRGLDLFRPLAVGYAGVLAWVRHEDMTRPWLAALVLAVLAAWSLALLRHRRRTVGLLAAETALAVGAVLATLLVESRDAVRAGQLTLPTIWAAAPAQPGRARPLRPGPRAGGRGRRRVTGIREVGWVPASRHTGSGLRAGRPPSGRALGAAPRGTYPCAS